MNPTPFEFTPEEQEHIRNTMQAVIDSVNAFMDAFVEIAKAVLEVIRKTFEGLVRLFAKLQLLEWRLPYRMAEYLSSKMPMWLAYKMGAAWLHSNVPALE